MKKQKPKVREIELPGTNMETTREAIFRPVKIRQHDPRPNDA